MDSKLSDYFSSELGVVGDLGGKAGWRAVAYLNAKAV